MKRNAKFLIYAIFEIVTKNFLTFRNQILQLKVSENNRNQLN